MRIPPFRRRRRRAFAVRLLAVIALGAGLGAMLAAPDIDRAVAAFAPAAVGEPITAGFTICHTGGGTNCVVDGDTLWLAGEKIRIADIDAPETHSPRCAEEADLGERATDRLQALLNAGAITLADEGTDRYGRRLAVVRRDGRSVGMTLVAEGLARRWDGRRRPWCDQA